MRSVNKETSTEKGRGRRPMRREMDEREKLMFEKLRNLERQRECGGKNGRRLEKK